MCQAISLISIPIGRNDSYVYYSNLDNRKKRNEYGNDSHTTIAKRAVAECSFFARLLKSAKARNRYTEPCDVVNKWEWNPFTNNLRTDRIGCKINDKAVIKAFVKTLDPKDIIGTKVRLTKPYPSSHCFSVHYFKGKQKFQMQSLYIDISSIPSKYRSSSSILATVYRKRTGGWSFKNFRKG